jgi:hypothetical protein
VDDEANNSQIEMLGRMGSLAHDVRRFASQIHADFLTVRWDSGLVITWDAGQLKLTTTEVPGSLTLSQLELCLAAWKGDRPGGATWCFLARRRRLGVSGDGLGRGCSSRSSGWRLLPAEAPAGEAEVRRRPR